jgi:hypothetical protein
MKGMVDLATSLELIAEAREQSWSDERAAYALDLDKACRFVCADEDERGLVWLLLQPQNWNDALAWAAWVLADRER